MSSKEEIIAGLADEYAEQLTFLRSQNPIYNTFTNRELVSHFILRGIEARQ